MKTLVSTALLAAAGLSMAQSGYYFDRNGATPVLFQPVQTFNVKQTASIDWSAMLNLTGTIKLGSSISYSDYLGSTGVRFTVGIGFLFGDTWSGAFRDLHPGVIVGFRF
jgi:hypothetical protein